MMAEGSPYDHILKEFKIMEMWIVFLNVFYSKIKFINETEKYLQTKHF